MAPIHFTTAVFVDSLFVTQTIHEARETYPNLAESDISLDAIMSRIIHYTGFDNYMVYYFEIPAEHLKPAINLASIGKTRKIKGKSVKFQWVEADLIAPELADFFGNLSNFNGSKPTSLPPSWLIFLFSIKAALSIPCWLPTILFTAPGLEKAAIIPT